ncbi:RING finger protein 10 [Venturia canescens]|uniref:RING finger protein 10 n=1 Tax=Venturia canescens TaxID=32260 RepID=UPI001C9CA419|nr:RING finger protein 10 [Venturia canescens]
MDKKPKYTQSSAKGTSPGDSKKNQDVVNGSRIFPKTCRRRESSGTTGGYNKNEQQSKKANAQKTRSFDKRPKPKGLYHGGAKEDTKVEEEEVAELGSVMVPGSKKQNLNHLLNFHYAPRDVTTNSGGWTYTRGDPTENKRRLPLIHRHKYNKEQFLQANCQFVVKDNANYSAHLADPDTLVDWNLIEQIRMYSSGRLSCPICLYPPVAGKMTRCGHVYCWPCILHYLALSDKAWRKCPICYESVHKSDLKSFVEVSQNHLGVGDEVKLRLMRRERGSLIAVPVCETETTLPTNFASVAEANSREIYSKLLLASVSDVMDIIESERVQLRLELTEDPKSPENCFVEQALADLASREQQVFGVIKSTKSDDENPNGNELTVENPTETINDTAGDSGNTDSVQDRTPESLGPQALSKFFYFYQAMDGQHLYLHAMNIKMLELQYGNLENCPRTIWGKILEKEVGSFSEELRRRMRYLHHLPLTCTFEIAEIELGPPLITDEVRGYFAEQVGNREKRRRRRERDERKREKKIITEENKQMGKFTAPKVHIESRKHFPQWQPDESQSTGISVPSPAESVATSSVASSPSRGSYLEDKNLVISSHFDLSQASSVDQQHQSMGPSFAQMLQNKGMPLSSKNTVTWPSINPQIDSSLSNRSSTSTVLEDDEGAYAAAAPSYNQSFCHDLAQSLSVADFFQTGKNRAEVNSSGKKKKKRCKTTVLFANSMSRAS